MVGEIYCGKTPIERVYFGREIIFQSDVAEPIEFHLIEDDKLIILGAYTVKDSSDGLYLDCAPDVPVGEWAYPVLNGSVLTIEQVYSATQNGNVLEVK